MALILSGTAAAQDALRSALSLDRQIAPKQNALVDLRPDQPHIGHVQLTLGAYASTGYDDNVNASENHPASDIILRTGVNLGFYWPATEQSELRFGSGIGYSYYFNNTRNGGVEVTPDSALTYSVALQDAIITVFDQLSYSRQVITEGALANLATLPRLDNNVGVRGVWNPKQWSFQAGYSHDDFSSDMKAANYLNRSSEYLFARGGWRFAQATQVGIEASGSFTKYESSSQSDNRSVSVGPFAEWQVRPALQLALRGGPTVYFFDSQHSRSPAATLSSYYLGLEGDYQMTDYFSHHLSIQRSVQPGLNQGSDYIEQITASYVLSWSFTQSMTLRAELTYENGNQPLPVAIGGRILNEIESFERYGGGPSLSWRLTDHLTTTVNYSHWLRQSNLAARGYTENSVSLGLRYSF